jgi:hypothetical protein
MVINRTAITVRHVAHVDESRNAYCGVMRKPEGILDIYVGIILK